LCSIWAWNVKKFCVKQGDGQKLVPE
jgi:hypothetical protein